MTNIIKIPSFSRFKKCFHSNLQLLLESASTLAWSKPLRSWMVKSYICNLYNHRADCLSGFLNCSNHRRAAWSVLKENLCSFWYGSVLVMPYSLKVSSWTRNSSFQAWILIFTEVSTLWPYQVHPFLETKPRRYRYC